MVCVAAALAAWGGSAWAQDGAVGITAGAQPRDVVVSVQNGANNCGMQIRFGDGREEKKRLEAGEVWTVNHSYAADGNFGIQAEGVLVVRGLRTVGPCNFGNQALLAVAGANASLQVAAAAPAPAQATGGTAPSPALGEHLDMVVMVRKNANGLRFVNSLDGGKRLANGEELARNGTSACVIKYPSAYAGIDDTQVDDLARGELRRYLAQLANARDVAVRAAECIAGTGDSARFRPAADVVMVQRQALPVLTNASNEFAQGYETLHDIPHTGLFSQAERIREAEARRQQAVANRAQEFEALAAADSQDKVGSIAFGAPRAAGLVAFCTIKHTGEHGAAMLGYGQRGADTQSDAFRRQGAQVRATHDPGKPFAKVYDSVEELYEARQTRPDECLVYVDYPGNLRKVVSALQRDGKPVPAVGELLAASELRDAWAKRVGYQDYAQYLMAREMNVNVQQFRSLADFRVVDKAALDAAVRDMQSSRYANGSDVGDVLNFLRDKAEAANRPGATALSVRDARQRAAREAAEANAAAERRRREAYAQEFPYIAVLTCGMPGHINILACFSGGSRGVDTELTLRNGNSSAMYKVYNINQAGQERRDGFYIDLRSNFEIRAQNADSTLILGLKIVDRVSGRVLRQDQAARFGVVAARN